MTHPANPHGIIVPTLIPFAEDGNILFRSVTDQARRLALIDGVSGVAVHTQERERMTLTRAEIEEVIVSTRKGLRQNQSLLNGNGKTPLSIDNMSADYKAVPTDAAVARKPTVHHHAPLSWLSYLAPHEATFYRVSENDGLFDANAMNNRLRSLVELINCHDPDTREMIYRETAHYRGLLASIDARDIGALHPRLRRKLHRTIEELDPKPISWI